MLAELNIRDIVLIDKLDLKMQIGLSALTGETGAGKSILLDAFALALGGRGDGSLVRSGQTQGQVTAVFDLNAQHPAHALLSEAGIDSEDVLILRRQQFADGKSRAFINDRAVSVQVLKQIGATLVEIHGQHDDRAMLDPSQHRLLLDAFGGLSDDVSAIETAYAALRKARSELAAQQARIEKARSEADYLSHAAAELEKLGAEQGEEDKLAQRRAEMMASEKVAGELKEAVDALSGHHSPLPMLSNLSRRLERRAAQAPDLLGEPVRALDVAVNALADASDVLERALRASNFDPKELEQIEERLFALRAASRKYKTPVEALPALAARFMADLAALDAGEGHLKALITALAEAEAHFKRLGKALTDKRIATAKALDAAVNHELPPLKLERARFITNITTQGEPAAYGFDHIEFHVETNPGTKPGPMMKVASGGELARFMLALKVVLAEKGSVATLVFDEIDSGVGGAVADAIGQRLKRLSARAQVLCVTHAPQVAAKASQHLLISKQKVEAENRVATGVLPLAPDPRLEEIARMLSGEHITPEARAAAAKLIGAA